jgi:adenosylcobinamide-GDP ribazoletransferase
VAIARYPYLKPTGKGAFHKESIRSFWDAIPSLLGLLSLSGVQVALNPAQWPLALGMAVGGVAIAWLTGTWFNQKLGGHTGDTYGAVVEWTETILLCSLVGLTRWV